MRVRVLMAFMFGIGLSMSLPGLADGAEPTLSKCPSSQSGSEHATVPATLRALEEKGEHLPIKSLQFTIKTTLQASGSTLVLVENGQSRFSPRETEATVTALVQKHSGAHTAEVTRERDIGSTHYSYDSKLKKIDGGRPWVREHLTPEQIQEEKTSKAKGPEELLTSLTGPLSDAQSIEEAGQKTVDGHTVEQFNITFAPGEYPSKELAYGSLFESEFCKPTIEVKLSVEPSGVPFLTTVSAKYQNSKRTVTSITDLEIPAINSPFAALKPPPANQTIGNAALQRIRSKQLRKQLAKLKKRKHKPHRKGH